MTKTECFYGELIGDDERLEMRSQSWGLVMSSKKGRQ